MDNACPSSELEKPRLTLYFCDFWSAFNVEDNFILDILKREYTPVLDRENPRCLFYSSHGLRHLRYPNAVRIYYTEENTAPDFNVADYGIGSNDLSYGERYLYCPPCFRPHMEPAQLTPPPADPALARRRFCNFIYSNSSTGEGARIRQQFCQALMRYKQVDCPGRVLHNMDTDELADRRDAAHWNRSKLDFLHRYKFTIAFENQNMAGYVTEKLTDCFLAHTVPIYWGSEGSLRDFNREACIMAQDYPDWESLITRIRELDTDDAAYLRLLSTPPLKPGVTWDRREEVAAFILQAVRRQAPFTKDSFDYSATACMRDIVLHCGRFKLSARYWKQKLLSGITCGVTRQRWKNAARRTRKGLRNILELRGKRWK